MVQLRTCNWSVESWLDSPRFSAPRDDCDVAEAPAGMCAKVSQLCPHRRPSEASIEVAVLPALPCCEATEDAAVMSGGAAVLSSLVPLGYEFIWSAFANRFSEGRCALVCACDGSGRLCRVATSTCHA